MQHHRTHKLIPIIIILALVVSLMSPAAVLADDAGPTEVATEEAPVSEIVDAPVSESEATETVAESEGEIEAAETEEPVVSDEVSGEDGATPESVDATEPVSIIDASEVVVEEAEPVTEAVVEVPSAEAEVVEELTEIVDVIADTGAVLTDEDGNTVSLASVEAAEALTGSDPYFQDGGVWYGYSSTGICPPIVTVCTTTTTPVQDAINAAPVSATVFVESGVYNEQITINKSITLQGAGSATTTLQAPTLAPDVNGQRNLITITGAGVNVELTDFTIAGPGSGGCNTINYGILVIGGANAFIHDNVITDVRDDPLSGCQNGVAIRVGTAAGGSGTATIQDNVIEDFQKGGIVISGIGSDAEISGNTVTGAGPTTVLAQNGIQVSSGATAEITDNDISGFSYQGTAAVATGILLYQPGEGVVVDDNRVSDSDVGVYDLGGVNTTISNNTITGACWATSGASTCDLGGWGIYADGSTNISVTGNTISDNTYGVGVFDITGAITGNVISGNAFGLINDGTTEVNAINNCWGSVTGPTHTTNPGGTGDSVSDDVIFSPWDDCAPDPDPEEPPTSEPTPPSNTPGAPQPSPDLLIPVTGAEFVDLNCGLATLFTLTLENENRAIFSCNIGGQVGLQDETEETLPDVVPDGDTLVWGMTTTVLNGVEPVTTLPAGASITLSFVVPDEFAGEELAILFWDPSANDELGGWVELDGSTLDAAEGRLLQTVAFTGTFVMVVR